MSTQEITRWFMDPRSEERPRRLNDAEVEQFVRECQETGWKSFAGIISYEDLSVRALVRLSDVMPITIERLNALAGPYIMNFDNEPRSLNGVMLYHRVESDE